jgi:hypothetical protein
MGTAGQGVLPRGEQRTPLLLVHGPVSRRPGKRRTLRRWLPRSRTVAFCLGLAARSDRRYTYRSRRAGLQQRGGSDDERSRQRGNGSGAPPRAPEVSSTSLVLPTTWRTVGASWPSAKRVATQRIAQRPASCVSRMGPDAPSSTAAIGGRTLITGLRLDGSASATQHRWVASQASCRLGPAPRGHS